MKLVEFSVQNYRSITTAHKIKLHDFTVLLGKNNEGKSNLLTALNVAMQIMMLNSRRSIGSHRNSHYNWERDFPIQLQGRKQGKESIFRLNFRLEEPELEKFHDETGIHGNEDVPIVIKIGADNKGKVEIPKKGSPAYKKKAIQITEFISERISFNYIQAVRTEGMTLNAIQEVVQEAMERALATSQDDAKYKEALQIITNMRQNVLDDIASKLCEPLKYFLPELKKISIKQMRSNSNHMYFLRRSYYNSDIEVYIDDGIETNIANKGDGIKSLVTLAILKEKRKFNGASVIAIEEPESHLHPGAIHNLVDVLHGMAVNNQVIISTHNPLFVQRNQINANIIINNGEAHIAKNIKEIRDVLGVWPSDNLKNARFVIVVEGESDKIALRKILSSLSSTIGQAFNSNKLVINSLGGVGNLSHDLMDLNNNMCQYVVLLDNDNAAREAAEKARGKGVLRDSEIRYACCNGQSDSEFEDCIKNQIYKDVLEGTYKIRMKCSEFHGRDKWSNRIKKVFLAQGMQWNDRIEKEVKNLVANSIPERIENIDDVLIREKCGFVENLIILVEQMIAGEIF